MITYSIAKEYNGSNLAIGEPILEQIHNHFKSKNLSKIKKNHIEINPLCDNEIMKYFENFDTVLYTDNSRAMILHEDHAIKIEYGHFKNYSVIYYIIYTETFSKLNEVDDKFSSLFNDIRKRVSRLSIRWYYTAHGGADIDYQVLSEIIDDEIYSEAYPFLDYNLNEFIDNYLKSKQKVLVLIGPPGTGKTRLIRSILRRQLMIVEERENSLNSDLSSADEPSPEIVNKNGRHETELEVDYTTDMGVLNFERIYLNLLTGRPSSLVLEDIDFHLKSRKEGNPIMHKLLSASDGLILNNQEYKVIVSTNLASENEIDEAFIRPGRCFSVVKTRKLGLDESKSLLKKITNKKIELEKNEYTLAELYTLSRGETFKPRKNDIKKVGF